MFQTTFVPNSTLFDAVRRPAGETDKDEGGMGGRGAVRAVDDFSRRSALVENLSRLCANTESTHFFAQYRSSRPRRRPRPRPERPAKGDGFVGEVVAGGLGVVVENVVVGAVVVGAAEAVENRAAEGDQRR